MTYLLFLIGFAVFFQGKGKKLTTQIVTKMVKTAKTATFIIFQTPEEGVGIPLALAGFREGFDALP